MRKILMLCCGFALLSACATPYQKAKKETAREILQMIYDKGKDTAMICLPTIAIKQLAKAYGIELED